MAWVAADKDKTEWVYYVKPVRIEAEWGPGASISYVLLPKGSIKKLIGRDLTWEDEPVELKEN